MDLIIFFLHLTVAVVIKYQVNLDYSLFDLYSSKIQIVLPFALDLTLLLLFLFSHLNFLFSHLILVFEVEA